MQCKMAIQTKRPVDCKQIQSFEITKYSYPWHVIMSRLSKFATAEDVTVSRSELSWRIVISSQIKRSSSNEFRRRLLIIPATTPNKN